MDRTIESVFFLCVDWSYAAANLRATSCISGEERQAATKSAISAAVGGVNKSTSLLLDHARGQRLQVIEIVTVSVLLIAIRLHP